MSYLKSYKELIVWQKSIELVKQIYIITGKFPKVELYGIISQMRRAVISIPSTIAEGYGRKSPKEYAQYLSIAYGSALELETQIIISKELNFVKPGDFTKAEDLLMEVSKMLNSMTSKFKNLNARP